MLLLRIAFRRETAMPMLALILASLVTVLLVVARIAVARSFGYAFLVWNLFLAWLPLIFALLAQETFAENGRRNWHFLTFTGAWLLFFPNAPYIFTDVVHLRSNYFGHYWVDLSLILLCALTGLVLGFVSLYVMQSLVTRMFGRPASWLFIAAVAGLSGFGIYLGRCLRFNSWDVLFKPLELYQEIGNWTSHTSGRATAFLFPAVFSTFLFFAYLMLYALTHLQPAQPTSGRPPQNLELA